MPNGQTGPALDVQNDTWIKKKEQFHLLKTTYDNSYDNGPLDPGGLEEELSKFSQNFPINGKKN